MISGLILLLLAYGLFRLAWTIPGRSVGRIYGSIVVLALSGILAFAGIIRIFIWLW